MTSLLYTKSVSPGRLSACFRRDNSRRKHLQNRTITYRRLHRRQAYLQLRSRRACRRRRKRRAYLRLRMQRKRQPPSCSSQTGLKATFYSLHSGIQRTIQPPVLNIVRNIMLPTSTHLFVTIAFKRSFHGRHTHRKLRPVMI